MSLESSSNKKLSHVAIVFEADWYNGLALIRGLGKFSVEIYALSSNKNAIGFHSKYITHKSVNPDPDVDTEQFINFMLEFSDKLREQNKIGVLFLTSDQLIKIFSENEQLFKNKFIYPFSNNNVIQTCLDKANQCRMANELNVPMPVTYYDSEIEKLYQDIKTKAIHFPVILKARHSHERHVRENFRTVIINDNTELDTAINRVKENKIPYIVQEIIPGNDDTLYTLGSYMNKDGYFKATFTGRKLRQKPPHYGICRVGESIFVPEIIRDGQKLLNKLGFHGISQIEFKYDHRDQQYKLIEINPRSWSWIGLPIKMGINIPYACFCDNSNINIDSFDMVDKKYIWIALEDDILFSLRHKDGIPLWHLFVKKSGISEAYLALSDPLPALYHIKEFFSQRK